GSNVSFYNALSAGSRAAGATASSATNRGYGLNTDYSFLGAGDGNTLTTTITCLVPGHTYALNFEQGNGSLWYGYQLVAADAALNPADVAVDPYVTAQYNGGWRVQVGGNPVQDFMNTSQQIYSTIAAGVAPYTGPQTDTTPVTGFDWNTFTPGWQKSTYTFIANASTMNVTFTSLASGTANASAPALVADETRLASLGTGGQYKSYTLLDDVTVTAVNGCDWGDLADTGAGTGPANYRTLSSDNGPAHVLISGLQLGSSVNGEADGQPNSLAAGDIGDDGVVLPALVKGATATVTVTATNTTGTPAYVSMWIDWNSNGNFEEAGEKVANDVLVPTGTTNGVFTINVTVPAAAVVGAQVGLRTRLSNTSALTSVGIAQSGEVEDYLTAPILQGMTLGNLVWNDTNNDGLYQSASESGVDGVTVTAIGLGADNTLSTGDDTTQTMVTSGGGFYSFVVAPGKYIVKVNPTGTLPLASGTTVIADNGVDNDNNGKQSGGVGTVIASPTVTLTANSEPGTSGTTNIDNTIDFGIRGCPTLLLSPSTLAQATSYVAYSQTVTASAGVAPYTFVKTGALPGGVTMATTASSLTLSGTPDGSTAPGNYPLSFQITDALSCSSTVNLTLVLNCPVINVVPGTLPSGTQDTPYDQTMTASGGTAPYIFTVTGTVPAGLTTASPTMSTFRLSGTPTTVESRTFTVRATDKWGCFKDTVYSVAIGCPIITISPSTLPAATQYAAISSVTFSAGGGRTPYTWSVDSATPLPAGLSLSSAGVLSGTPTAAPNTYNFNIKLVDNSGCPASASYPYTINCPAITITTSSPLPVATVGTAITPITLAATTAGAAVPAQVYTWAVTSGSLPSGLSLNASTGVISGTPTTAVTNQAFTVGVVNQQNCPGSKAFTMSTSCPTVTLSPSSLPAATQYASYSQAITASGGSAPYAISLNAGSSLPAGLSLTGATSTTINLSGTPTAGAGTYIFTFRTVDNYGCVATKPCSLVINCAPITITPATVPAATQFAAYSQQFTATMSGTGVPAQTYTWSITAGSLPSGVSFGSTGLISGNPWGSPGSYPFTVQVVNATGCSATQSYTLVVNCPAISVALAGASDPIVWSNVTRASIVGTSGATYGLGQYTATGTAQNQTYTANFHALYDVSTDSGPTFTASSISFLQGDAVSNSTLDSSMPFTIAGPAGYAYRYFNSTTNSLKSGATLLSTDVSSTGSDFGYSDTANFQRINASAFERKALASDGSTNVATDVFFNTAANAFNVTYNSTGYPATGVAVSIAGVNVGTASAPGSLVVGAPYRSAAVAGGGQAPYTYAISAGALPSGLSLSATTGAISGTPSSAGTYTFTMRATDANGCTGTQVITLTPACPAITVTTSASLALATQYTSYSASLTATGGSQPYSWSVVSGALPAGLSLNASTGIISGVPTAEPATYNFTVQLADAYACATTKAFSIVVACPTITITPATLPDGIQYAAYSQTLTATITGTNVPNQTYTWSISNGSLPAGLTLNSSTGVISGTATTIQSQTFTVQVANTTNCFGVQTYTVAVGCPPINITPATLASATQYAPYSQQFTATTTGINVPTQAYTWGLDTGSTLPSGLSLSNAGLLNGTPTAAPGNYNFRLKVINADNCPGYQSYVLTILCPPLTFVPAGLPVATVGTAYSQTITASGGTPAYTYTITSGTLPNGLSFDGNTGVLSGNPNVMPAAFPITIRATDVSGCTGTISYTLTVIGYDYGDFSGLPS
ncbi:MAG: hypothetical protein JWO08_4748, partial [Verrucomicrobiaceae bacterium]|nr:hypothetical protein [Verrucomicrobiaceae bacterium]